MKATTPRAFSLTELLVVIGILSILAAFLFPVFVRARQETVISRCVSNLHQIGLALRMYQADWGGNLPRPAYGPSKPWKMDSLLPYLHNAEVLSCPSGRANSASYDYHWTGIPGVTLRPQSGTVVALCQQHLDQFVNPDGVRVHSFTQGLYTVVREDASASRVIASRVQLWNYRSGQWMHNAGSGPPDYLQFPDEPWPPDFGG